MPGSKPDLHRHRQIAELRASGMSYQAIGDGLGISHQRVYQILERSGTSHRVLIRCLKCKAVITKMRMFANNNGPVYCMNCLPPDATFGERLKARRLAAGLTLEGLAKQAETYSQTIGNYEQGARQPNWQTLAKLIRVLGVDWLAVK
jgi:DNA-binding XRE family transcriptional regulator